MPIISNEPVQVEQHALLLGALPYGAEEAERRASRS